MSTIENSLADAIRNFKSMHSEHKQTVTCANCGFSIDNPNKPCKKCFPNPPLEIDGIPKDLLNNTYPGYDPDSTRRAIGENS